MEQEVTLIDVDSGETMQAILWAVAEDGRTILARVPNTTVDFELRRRAGGYFRGVLGGRCFSIGFSPEGPLAASPASNHERKR